MNRIYRYVQYSNLQYSTLLAATDFFYHNRS